MAVNGDGRVAIEGKGMGVEVDVGVDAPPDNDVMMVVATKLLHGDVAGGAAVTHSVPNIFAGEGVFIVAGVTFNNPLSKTNINLEVENDVRGWELAGVTV